MLNHQGELSSPGPQLTCLTLLLEPLSLDATVHCPCDIFIVCVEFSWTAGTFFFLLLVRVVRLKEFTGARQDKFMVKITDANENSLGTKIVVADLKWGGSPEAGEVSKKSQKVRERERDLSLLGIMQRHHP